MILYGFHVISSAIFIIIIIIILIIIIIIIILEVWPHFSNVLFFLAKNLFPDVEGSARNEWDIRKFRGYLEIRNFMSSTIWPHIRRLADVRPHFPDAPPFLNIMIF